MSHTLHTTTSSNRPTHEPGLIALETDTGNIIMSDGSIWHVHTYDETKCCGVTYDETHVSIYTRVSIHDSAQFIELLASLRAETA